MARVRARSALPCLLALGLLAAGAPARADTCGITMSEVSFGLVSPIANSEQYATGSGTVTCSWSLLSPLPPFVLLFPNVVICVNAGLGTNSTAYNARKLGFGGHLIDYNLYTASSYAAATTWGSAAQAGTVGLNFSGGVAPLVGGSIVRNFTIYGKLPASSSLASAPSDSNANTVYSSTFGGTMTYAFYNLIQPACTAGASVAFAFTAKATVINDCQITVGPLAFTSTGNLSAARRATSAMSVQCTNNNAWKVALNGGAVAGNMAARKMRKLSGGETIAYEIASTLDGTSWGDGTAGTVVVSGTGTGAAQPVTVYGRVPAQTAPSPGDYKDTVTATVIF